MRLRPVFWSCTLESECIGLLIEYGWQSTASPPGKFVHYIKVLIDDMSRAVENDIAIICSSMPACASFAKASLMGLGNFASFRSRFTALKGAYRSKASSKLNNSHSTQVESPSSELTNYVRLKDQLKPDNTIGLFPNTHTANYTTEVFSEHKPADVETGVIKKSVSRSISYQARA